jgi:hypothetical protein
MTPVYIIRNDDIKRAVKEQIDQLPIDPLYQVEIHEHHRNRSLAANRLLWAWLRQISDQYEDTRGKRFSPESWKEHFQRTYLGKEVIEMPMGGYAIVGKGTSSLSVRNFSDFLTRIERDAVELGVKLTHTGDYDMAMTGHLDAQDA